MKCDACGGFGWLHAFNTDKDKNEIQRCDSCAIIVSDEAASFIHSTSCKCDWDIRFSPEKARVGKQSCGRGGGAMRETPPFNVASIARSVAKTAGSHIEKELSEPITGLIAPRVHTVVCDGIAHEYRRVRKAVSNCASCTPKVMALEEEAHKQRFRV